MLQRSGVVAVNGPFKEVGPTDDGTPPSNGLAEELYHSYAARSYSGSARRPWLGTEMLQDAGISMPEARLDQAAKGLAASPVESGPTDIVSLMEATWFGPHPSRYGTSGSSGFSGFHDSATSMSPGPRGSGKARKGPGAAKEASGSHDSANSSGRSRASLASSASNGALVELDLHLPEAGPLADTRPLAQAAQPPALPNGMATLPEDTAVASSAQQEERVQSGKHAGTTGHASGMPGWLGTWTKRQVHYRRQPPPSLPARIPGTPQDSGDAHLAPKARPAEQRNGFHPSAAAFPPDAPALSPNNGAEPKGADAVTATGLVPSPNGGVAEPVLTERERRTAALARAASEGVPGEAMQRKGSADALADEEEGLRQEAWRWRFNQRWAQEQARQMDPEYGRQAGDEDGWDEALGYMDACGPGWHLQIARTTSDDGLANTGSLISHPSGLSTCFLGDSQPRSRTLAATAEGSAMGEATKGIMAKARMAAEMYQQQAAIESQVKQRWDSAAQSGGLSWAGQELPAVQIDRFGHFTYVLVRLSDRLAGSKLLVRGHNGCSEEQLVSAVTKEVLAVTARGRLPQASVTLMGSGSMEWSRERDRTINVSAGKMVAGLEGSIHSREDIVRLAAALTRSSLPMHYHVSIEGGKV